MDRRHRGVLVESLALEHLLAHRLVLVERNYRCRLGEIDLIMRDGSALVFVEVRYRRLSRFGGATASVDARKQRKLVRTAEHYLSGRRDVPACRFDVVAVGGELDAPRLAWLRSAFEA